MSSAKQPGLKTLVATGRALPAKLLELALITTS
jgi:hypothetical protein